MAISILATDQRREWTAARDVQQRFMQASAPAGSALEYSAQCRQLGDLGGDYYDFFPLAGPGLTLAIGDASGKGVAAALMIANVQSSLRTAAQFTGYDVPAALRAVNRHVHATSLAHCYATLFYGVFDRTTRSLRYVNAGHNPPLVMRRNGSIEWLEAGGAPVGMFPDWHYKEGIVQLEPGDLVLAYSDGIVEAENPSGEMWGIENLEKIAARVHERTAAEIVQAIFDSTDEFTLGSRTDDATVAVLRVR